MERAADQGSGYLQTFRHRARKAEGKSHDPEREPDPAGGRYGNTLFGDEDCECNGDRNLTAQ